jgi:hypothetical protein
MFVESQDSLYQWSRSTSKALGRISKWFYPMLRPVKDSRFLSPFRNRFSILVEKGEDEVKQWVEIGRVEEQKGQQMAEDTFYDIIDFWVHYFAEDPEVVGLVTSQSVSFAEEVIEEVRERAVSADNYIEGLVRYFLRRTPRNDLPEPPQRVKAQALYNNRVRNRLPLP